MFKWFYSRWDSLTLYDGDSNMADMIGKYCGSYPPPNIISSSNSVSLYFQSDGSVTDKGFKLRYNAYTT